MMGGHSGEDIHRGRGSAIRLLSRMLFAARRAIPIQLAGLTGGVFRLAIAREASAVIGVPAHVTDGFLALMETMERPLRQNIRAPILGSFSPRPQSLRMNRSGPFRQGDQGPHPVPDSHAPRVME